MSGAPKRLHDDGSHPTTSKRSVEEGGVFLNSTGKLIQTSIGHSHLPFEQGQDGRAAKVQRIEPREVDKRSSLLPVYRITSSANVSCLDHTVATESRTELRDSKERDSKSDARETETEARELYMDSRIDPQVNKAENDSRQENKVDDKLARSDRECHSDFKSDIRLDKDVYGGNASHISWKEPKEHHRAKRYCESPGDVLDPWRSTWHGSQNSEEGVKEGLTGEERETLKAREAVGENRVDLKGEEKLKDKERKRKDDKVKEWAEKDKERSDCRNNPKLSNISNEHKDFMREDRETERWDRERKDAQKDKERKDRDKDHSKREMSNTNEKDNFHNEKEMVEGSSKIPEQDCPTLESKRINEFDSWKALDRDIKDKKRERDPDTEVDKYERRSRCYEKESEDGSAEGATERDREVFGYSVQQRRRMLRPRGTPQSSNREPRFRSRARENEGSQGKPEASTITYKVGECMQELLKSWKEFEASQDGKIDGGLQNGPTLEIRIPAEHVTATNRQVRGGQLWGTDIYTDDSDLVAVLMHTGYCRPTASLPPPAIQELRATIRLLLPQNCYYSTLRNNVRSRAWGAGIGCSFRVERCCILKKGGGTIDLEPCLTLISAVEPTLAPVSVERTMTTRAAASNALRQQRFVREVTIQYNLCNEPWVKYSINFVADKGLKKPLYTSARLKKGEVLYLETHFNRYELCYNGEKAVCNGTTVPFSQLPESEQEKAQNHGFHVQTADRNQERGNLMDVFRWSRCKKPLPQEVMRSIGIPLPAEHVEVLEENLEWEDVQWSQTGVWVAGKEYALARVHFLFRT